MPSLTEQKGRVWMGCMGAACLLAFVILLPISFSYVEYYEYGIVMRQSTGSVDTSRVYGRGRYALGPDRKFLKYQADAHHGRFNDLAVFSANEGEFGDSVGLAFEVDVDFTFFLQRDQIGVLHEQLATSYRSSILSRTRVAIRNKAANVTFTQYFRDRKLVEQSFREAVQDRLNEAPPLHCTLDQFHLGRIKIPERVAEKQLQARLQIERNQMESFHQQAEVERELTAVDVKTIELAKEKLLATARAEANLTIANARVEAIRIVQEAQINGTKVLFDATGINDQEQKTAFDYIRTLTKREKDYHLGISYLPANNVVRIAGAGV